MPVGAEVLEDRVTLGVCANAAGTHRLPLLFVGHFENPRSFKAFRQSCPVFYRSNVSACVTQKVFADWLQGCFVPEVDKHQLSTDSASRVLLLAQPSAGHHLTEELKSERVDVKALPASTASLTHPMHQGPIATLKAAFRERLVRRLHEANDVIEFYRDYDLRDCVNFCAESWAELTECALRSAWMKLVPVLRLEEAETPTTTSHEEALVEMVRLLQPLAKDIAIKDVSEWQHQLTLLEAGYVPCNAHDDVMQEHDAVDTSDDADALVVTNAFAVLKKWASKKSSKAKFQFDELFSSFYL
ncbi:tigger transposable element-derived protein 2-like [Frankliniella occidentalis]|uniref:Tigger transposable element-derived protein 2-like n=1 Tax=Frankliniella occidentalis TaxID=133901 RepID=A0A9C6TVB8_FRAOC|nr:tigger transposable element-derived protein 2-like [Frankliniella occidentalis]